MASEVCKRALKIAPVRRAKTVLVFASFGAEVPTPGLIQGLQEQGKRVFLPALRAGDIEAVEHVPGGVLVPSGYGPTEPGGYRAVNPEILDLVLVPGLAFDRSGHRIGYGGGHFDRFLRRSTRAVRIGLAFHQQLVDELPHDEGDEPMDLVMTDLETIECPR